MDEDMYRACKGPGAATFRHPVVSLPDLLSKTSRRTRQIVTPWPRQTSYHQITLPDRK